MKSYSATRVDLMSPKRRAEILDRDVECRKCGSLRRLEVHHIDQNRDNDSDENLIALCYWCHIIAPHQHSVEAFWDWFRTGESGTDRIIRGATAKCDEIFAGSPEWVAARGPLVAAMDSVYRMDATPRSGLGKKQ